MTTRRRDASLLAGRQLIDLEVFTVEEAGAYLRERLPAELADDIGGVATDLGCLPLALAQAAALMLDTELPCSGYRERFADRRRRLAEAFPHPDTLFDDTTATVATTWSISIEQANRLPPAGLAGRLLELASVLDPNGIPTAVFTTADALTFLTKDIAPTSWWRRRRRRAALTDASVREGLANLRRFNLVAVAGSVIQVHALVQRAARDHFGPAEAQTVVQAAADALLNTWPDHARDATLTALLRANATNLAAAAGAGALWHSALGGHLVLYQAMSSLADDGLLTAAIEAATELHQQAHTRLGPDHPYTLTTRVYMAQFRGQAGDAVGAAEAFERVLADRRRVLGDDHPHALSARYNMLFWRVEAGADAADAAEALELVLYDMLRVLGPDHPHTLAARTSVAHCRGKAGDAEGAVAALEQVVADRLRIGGPDHGDTLMARGLLAEWRGKAGDVAGAAVTFEQVHADRTRVLGPDDPQTLGGRGSLAFWQGEAGDPAGAAAAFGELLTDMLRVLGPDHPYTLNTRDELERWEREAARDSRVDE